MTRIIGRRLTHDRIPIASDRVVAAFPIPRGGRLNNIHLAMDMVALDAQSLSADQMVAYGVSVYVVPIPDPDASLAYDTAWDQLIPKDNALGDLVDLDTANASTNAAFEPGSFNIAGVFDMVGLMPKKIFQRRKYLSYASGFGAIGGAALDNWHPADSFSTKISRRVNCSMYSYVLVGVSSPDMTVTSTGFPDPPNEAEWAMIQYIDIFIEQMFIASLNLQETGAESPYEEAETFITELLEDTIAEDTADAFHPLIWNCFARATFDITVPGRQQLKVLTSEFN